MELEISRVNMLETIEKSKKTALRITFLSFPAILVGILFEDPFVANVGWAISCVSLLVWAGLIISTSLLGQRIPHELVEPDE